VSKAKEGRFCRSHTGHRQRVPLSSYLCHFYTKEKREKKPHLVDGFSPVLGFPGHILCLFVDGVIGFYCSLFSTFYIFHAYEENQ
jgi:hypothetical protein